MSEFIERVIAFLLVRVAYFVGAYFLLLVGYVLLVGATAFRTGGPYDSGTKLAGKMLTPEFWITMTIVAAVVALIGPGMYHRARQRGRGALAEIRAGSQISEELRERLDAAATAEQEPANKAHVSGNEFEECE